METLLDPNVALRVLLVDSDVNAAGRLSVALSRLRLRIGHGIDNATVSSIPEAYQTLTLYLPNIIFIDLVGTDLRDSITFVQHTSAL